MANPLTKEAGGQPVWAWGAEAVGAFILYRWWSSRQAASAAAASQGTTAGMVSPGAQSVISEGSGSSTPSSPQNWAQWLSEAVSAAAGPNYSATQAFNDFTSWINGGYVSSQGYNAIGNALETLGLPPGFGTGVPPIQVAPSTPSTGSSSGSVAAGGSPSGLASNWAHIPDPHIGSLISGIGVPYQTVGNSQYYDTTHLVAIPQTGQGYNLMQQGYKIIGFNGHEWYNPNQSQVVAGKTGSYQT